MVKAGKGKAPFVANGMCRLAPLTLVWLPNRGSEFEHISFQLQTYFTGVFVMTSFASLIKWSFLLLIPQKFPFPHLHRCGQWSRGAASP